jgi:hypothetical protein
MKVRMSFEATGVSPYQYISDPRMTASLPGRKKSSYVDQFKDHLQLIFDYGKGSDIGQ